jgi:cholesterol transport system auxiliary component
MINTSITFRPKCARFGTIVLAASMLCGCSMLFSANSPPPELFSFDSPQQTVQSAPHVKNGAPTLVVSIPRASAGFDSRQIIYVRQVHKLEHFRHSQWVDPPASMLSPLIVAALERSGQFSAVVQSPTSAVGQWRLDVEIVRLQHEFLMLPSRVHFTLRAHLLDTATRQVVAWREFDAIVPSASEDPYGGVLAANSAIRIVTEELAAFCVQESGTLQEIHP